MINLNINKNIIICLAAGSRMELPKANNLAIEKGLRITEQHMGSVDCLIHPMGGYIEYDSLEQTIRFDYKTLREKVYKYMKEMGESCIFDIEDIIEDPESCKREIEAVDEYTHGPKMGIRFAFDDGKYKDDIVYAERLHDFVRNTAYKGTFYITGAYYYNER